MNHQKYKSGAMTREQLKEIIKTNIELFREDPAFYDYFTDLMVYLFENEYESTKAKSVPVTSPEPSERSLKIGRIYKGSSVGMSSNLKSRSARSLSDTQQRRVLKINQSRERDDLCPQCSNEVKPETVICPFCLTMIQSED